MTLLGYTMGKQNKIIFFTTRFVAKTTRCTWTRDDQRETCLFPERTNQSPGTFRLSDQSERLQGSHLPPPTNQTLSKTCL